MGGLRRRERSFTATPPTRRRIEPASGPPTDAKSVSDADQSTWNMAKVKASIDEPSDGHPGCFAGVGGT
jgi:hypothetical protein